MTLQLELDLEATPILCANCGAEVTDDDNPMVTHDECQECYVNEDCPAGCSDPDCCAPDPFRYGPVWECESTGQTFYFYGDAGYGSWETPGRYESEPCLVGSTYHSCDDVFYCDGCDEYRHVDDYDEDGYCTEHNRAQSIDGVSLTLPRCETSGCRATITHFNPLTERAHCGEHASATDESLEALAA